MHKIQPKNIKTKPRSKSRFTFRFIESVILEEKRSNKTKNRIIKLKKYEKDDIWYENDQNIHKN